MLFAVLDDGKTVVSVTASDADISDATHIRLPDMTPVEAVLGRRWDGMAFAPPAPVPRTATGKQLRYALNDLGLRSAWDAAVAKANQATQDYWACCGSDWVPESNSKVGKLCAAVGTTPAALFDKAVDE